MFEKEAEEYGHEHCCDSCKNLQARYRKVFKDGATFGYNRGKQEAKEIIKKLLRLWNNVMTEETVKILITEAEQFLKEVKG